MKNYSKLFGLFAIATTPAFAGIIVGGDFNSDQMRHTGATTVQASDVNNGFVSTNNSRNTFNGTSATNIGSGTYGSYLFDSDSGNGGGFFLGTSGINQNGRSTAWSLFTMDTAGAKPGDYVTSLSIDVTVFLTYNTADQGLVASGGALSLLNSSNVQIALYGFTGDATALANSLSTDGVSVSGNKVGNPSGFAGYTEIISTTSLAPVTQFSDASVLSLNWETQTFNVSGTTGYDYYLFGIFGGNDTQGVGIDNISITAVPEPSTYIAGLGFIGIGYFIYRRRKQAAAASKEEAVS